MKNTDDVIDSLKKESYNWGFYGNPTMSHFPSNTMIYDALSPYSFWRLKIVIMGGYQNNHRSINPYISLINRFKLWFALRERKKIRYSKK